ncbi:MAG: GNAT family N-acetyltransferase [Planctomycetota bacterium]
MSAQVESVRGPHWTRIRALRLEALASDPEAFGSTLEAERDRPETWWRERADTPTTLSLIARVNGRDAGLCVASPWRELPGTLGLFGMWVAPWARRHGAGAALVRAVLNHARADGYRRVQLDVEARNAPARALYERSGFRPTGHRYRQEPPREHLVEEQLVHELD